MSLTAADFPAFFTAVHGSDSLPFPWQTRLAKRVCERGWPKAIALPTAAGKTGCIDIALFSLACRARPCPRRIFFVVDRRIVVDQAFRHARRLSETLANANSGILRSVADALRELAGHENKDVDELPLEAYSLRGGIYRETAWARSPIQPMVIASTVDQIGSRLLFRGYGVSDSMKPVHAGLVGNDALILLDEAHCSNPFRQTMEAVERFRTWADESAEPTPFQFVSITATPAADLPDEEVERDQQDDRDHPVLGVRLRAEKPATLVVAEKAKKSKWRGELVKELARQARQLMGRRLGPDKEAVEHSIRSVGIVVNRVATARELAAALRKPEDKNIAAEALPKVVLLTGRMRPIDRDEELQKISGLFSDSNDVVPPTYVVATQCIEVGADLDFDALVTECASLDALRQRFGRLNRVAARPAAKATIVIRGDQAAGSEDDPIYGESLSNTWKWMKKNAKGDVIDFGVSSMRELLRGPEAARLNALAPNAPVLFPAHLDCWVQTHPIPAPDPDPAVFLHGRQESVPDVQVVFRGDLGEDTNLWEDVVRLCPPSSSESMPVPIGVFKKWLAGEESPDILGDVEGGAELEGAGSSELPRPYERAALRWRGPRSKETKIVRSPQDTRPGDTFVVACNAEGIAALGDFLPGGPADRGELAFMLSRGKPLLRLLPVGFDREDVDFDEKLSDKVRAKLDAEFPDWPPQVQAALTSRRRAVEVHPRGGYVVSDNQRLAPGVISRLIPQFVEQAGPTFLDDSEANESSKSRRPVSLEEHSLGVAHHSRRFAAVCGLDENLYLRCGLFHDLGKLDPRNQAMLKSLAPRLAVGDPLAKSGAFGSGNPDMHRYPAGARHELLSAAMVAGKWNDDLLPHLIATHHGAARPFAPHVEENEAVVSPFTSKQFGESFDLASSAQRPADWNPILAERFWRIVRRYGWWGSAYRETVFRLADHMQSRQEQFGLTAHETPNFVRPNAHEKLHDLNALPLAGLEGTNPLAFLAALGTLRVLSMTPADLRPSWLGEETRLSWGLRDQPAVAVLHTAEPVAADELVEFVATLLVADPRRHPSRAALSLMSAGEDYDRVQLYDLTASRETRDQADWASAMFIELAPEVGSQLMVVRRDYVEGNFNSVMERTRSHHLFRTLFETWDYADALDNQSLHWEPSEDRRHAYQWYQASGDPTRKKCGGMLGANRLALEAWPLFISMSSRGRACTRGFSGSRANDTRWTWPLWFRPMNINAIVSLLSLAELQHETVHSPTLSSYGIFQANRCRRILVGKTPNLTPAYAI